MKWLKTHTHTPAKIHFPVVSSPVQLQSLWIQCKRSGRNVGEAGGTLKQTIKSCQSCWTPVGHSFSWDLRTYKNPDPETFFPKAFSDRKELPGWVLLAELGHACHCGGWEKGQWNAASLQYRRSTESYRMSHRNVVLCLAITPVSFPRATG